MKQTIISLVTLTALTACNTGGNNSSTKSADSLRTEVATSVSYTPPAGVDAKVAATVKGIVDAYLDLKNALTKDDSKEAAAAGKEIVAAISKVDMAAMNDEQRKAYHAVIDDAKEHAEHIGDNAGNIDHQREHFEMLGKDVEDLVKTFGGGQKLYKQFCTMAFDGKGAAMALSSVSVVTNSLRLKWASLN